jgi:hypothetical protein
VLSRSYTLQTNSCFFDLKPGRELLPASLAPAWVTRLRNKTIGRNVVSALRYVASSCLILPFAALFCALLFRLMSGCPRWLPSGCYFILPVLIFPAKKSGKAPEAASAMQRRPVLSWVNRERDLQTAMQLPSQAGGRCKFARHDHGSINCKSPINGQPSSVNSYTASSYFLNSELAVCPPNPKVLLSA